MVTLYLQLFEDDILLVDPTHEEESVSAGHVTIITTGGDNISHINKQGGASLNMQQLNQCIKKAKQRWTDICELLDKSKQQQADLRRIANMKIVNKYLYIDCRDHPANLTVGCRPVMVCVINYIHVVCVE